MLRGVRVRVGHPADHLVFYSALPISAFDPDTESLLLRRVQAGHVCVEIQLDDEAWHEISPKEH